MRKKITAFVMSVLFLAVLCVTHDVRPANILGVDAYAAAFPIPALTGNQRQDMINIALSQVGYKETGNDHTIYNEWFYGKDKSDPWCAIFISWCANKAGISTDIIYKNASSGALKNCGTKVSTPMPGDLAYYNGHIAIVTEKRGDVAYVVDGNYSQGVAAPHKYTDRSNFVGFYRPSYASPQAVEYTPPTLITEIENVNGYTVTVSATIEKYGKCDGYVNKIGWFVRKSDRNEAVIEPVLTSGPYYKINDENNPGKGKYLFTFNLKDSNLSASELSGEYCVRAYAETRAGNDTQRGWASNLCAFTTTPTILTTGANTSGKLSVTLSARPLTYGSDQYINKIGWYVRKAETEGEAFAEPTLKGTFYKDTEYSTTINLPPGNYVARSYAETVFGRGWGFDTVEFTVDEGIRYVLNDTNTYHYRDNSYYLNEISIAPSGLVIDAKSTGEIKRVLAKDGTELVLVKPIDEQTNFFYKTGEAFYIPAQDIGTQPRTVSETSLRYVNKEHVKTFYRFNDDKIYDSPTFFLKMGTQVRLYGEMLGEYVCVLLVDDFFNAYGNYEAFWVRKADLNYSKPAETVSPGTIYEENEPKPTNSANVPNGIYKVETKLKAGLFLDVLGGIDVVDNGANVGVWENTGKDNQKVRLERQSDNSYKITAVHSGKAISVQGGDTKPKANVHQWDWAGTDSQRWYIIDVGDGYYSFVAKHSGLYLDVLDFGTANGTNIQQENSNKTDAQKWKLIHSETVVTTTTTKAATTTTTTKSTTTTTTPTVTTPQPSKTTSTTQTPTYNTMDPTETSHIISMPLPPEILYDPNVNYGDVDGNKIVNVADVVAIARQLTAKIALTPEQCQAADVDRDGKITVLDLLAVIKFIFRD